jgi:D-alanyl-lipoteichoic acid acyltransferase DltB (MBOAT superfamily)
MLWWGIYGFSFQIYCDFLGYSQMARGVARLFGFRLMENFRAPFFAPNVRELWARWHISLTTWLRDYLYLSLGGGSRGQARQLANLFLTMLLAGLWHGAAGHYVVWGASFGVILVAHQLLFARRVGRRARRIGLRGFAMAVLGALVSFHAFALTMVLFRAQASGGRSALENAFDYFAGLLSVVNSAWQPPPVAMWVIVVVIFFDWLHLRCGTSEWARDWPWPVRGVVIGLLVSAAVIFGSPEAHTFIYFQF